MTHRERIRTAINYRELEMIRPGFQVSGDTEEACIFYPLTILFLLPLYGNLIWFHGGGACSVLCAE